MKKLQQQLQQIVQRPQLQRQRLQTRVTYHLLHSHLHLHVQQQAVRPLRRTWNATVVVRLSCVVWGRRWPGLARPQPHR